MASAARRSTVSIHPRLHRALRAKARRADCSISELVDEAVKRSLAEDAEDVAAFSSRARERSREFMQVVRKLRAYRSKATKQAVRDVLEKLPDRCTLDDVLYHVYVLQRISQGLAEADSGQLIPHEKVERDLRRRWRLGAG